MNLNPEQEAALARVREANKALKAAKVEAAEVAKRARREHIARHQAINDKAAAEAYILHGVPYSRIAEDGMGTTTHKTAKTAVQAGAEFVEKPVEAVEAPATVAFEPSRFEKVAVGVRVTLQPEDFAPYAHGLAAVPTEEQSFTFCLSDDGTLQPVDAHVDATWMHPVVTVVMNTPMKADVLAFIEEGRG